MSKKKIKLLLIIVFVLIVILFTLSLIFKTKISSDSIGKWIYKYTFLESGKLHYTEEDGMESYIELYKNNRYKIADYCDDIVEYGYWFETKQGIYLINEKEWLYKQEDGTLHTEIKDGKKVMFKGNFYNVLVKK